MIRKLALTTTLITLALPAAAHAASRMEFALQDDDVFVTERYMSREKGLQHAAALGAERIRANVLWARTLTTNENARRPPKGGPQYEFSAVDALQAAAAKRNIKLQLTLTGPAPAWATKNRIVGPYQPDPRAFAAFVRAVAI